MFGLTLKRVVFIVILAALILAATQYIPPYVTYYQLDNSVQHTVRFAAASRRTMNQVRLDVSLKAKELGIQITPDDIDIVRKDSNFTLEFAYVWPINMRVYQQTLTFEIKAVGEAFGP